MKLPCPKNTVFRGADFITEQQNDALSRMLISTIVVGSSAFAQSKSELCYCQHVLSRW